jgi:predicted nuclease of predicted toxin-antitoxin system
VPGVSVQFLADESCDLRIVKALRSAGHDVLAVSEISPRIEDSVVIDLAVKQRRIVLTEDKDFGQLVFAHGQKTGGVIFLRFPISARDQITKDLINLVNRQGEKLGGCFVTIQAGRIRISHIARD